VRRPPPCRRATLPSGPEPVDGPGRAGVATDDRPDPAASPTSVPGVDPRAAVAERPPTRRRRPTPVRKGTPIARIDDLMDKVDSRFHLVHLAAKRAREINGYYAQLGEGLGQFVPPLVSTPSNKPLSIALEEIAEGKIVGRQASGAPDEDPLGFIDPQGDEPA
jgi:DNA-directed RNA polymerase subunit omega